MGEPWEQMSLDLGGEELKAAGIAQAIDNAPSWYHAAAAWVRALPAGERFTSENVVAAVGLPRGEPGMNANNAVGATMNALRRSALITGTGQMVKSQRASSHAALIAVWERTDREQGEGGALAAQTRRVVEALSDGEWWTVRQLAEATGDLEESVSARLGELLTPPTYWRLESVYVSLGRWRYRIAGVLPPNERKSK